MEKKFKIFINLSVLVFVLASFISPAYAQGPTNPIDQCTLSRDVDITIKVPPPAPATDEIKTIHKDAVVSSVSAKTTGNVTDVGGGPAAMTAAQKDEISKRWGIICLINTINVIVDWVFYILIAVVFFFVASAAFFWTTSGGDTQRQSKAGAMVVAALVGLVIALLSRLIPSIVTGIFA